MDIGLRLKKLRESKGLSQNDVAQVLGISQTAYGKIETGARGLSSEYAIKLSDFYKTSCDYILRGVEAQNLDFVRLTGLTHESVHALRKWTKGGEDLKLVNEEESSQAESDEVVKTKDEKEARLFYDHADLGKIYFINRMIEYCDGLRDRFGRICWYIAEKTAEYLLDYKANGHSPKLRNDYVYRIKGAQYDASTQFDRFFHDIPRDPELIKALGIDNAEEIIEFGTQIEYYRSPGIDEREILRRYKAKHPEVK